MPRLICFISSGIIPGIDDEEPLTVNVSFSLVALTELNEVKGYISTVGFFTVTWYDDRMTWDSSDYDGLSEISIDHSKVWIPKLLITNPADRIYTFHEIASEVRYTSDGVAFWKPGSVMKTLCYIQIPAYPFDSHTCYISVGTWGGSTSEVILNIPSSIRTDFYGVNAEWTLNKTSTQTALVGTEISLAMFGIQFLRKPTFLVINILIPIVFLSLLNCVVFLLPYESGERVAFSITVLLSFTVFLNIIGDNIPKTSSPMPYVCHYVLIVLVTSGLIASAAILCQRLYYTRGEEPVPRWIPSCMCIHFGHKSNEVLSISIKDEKALSEEKPIMDESIVNWKQIVSRLDTILFVFFLAVAVSLALGFIITMANMREYSQY